VEAPLTDWLREAFDSSALVAAKAKGKEHKKHKKHKK
jgi:hypothetical protein